MKNYWLEKCSSKKNKVKIWMGSSITGGEEEFLGEIEAENDIVFSGWCGFEIDNVPSLNLEKAAINIRLSRKHCPVNFAKLPSDDYYRVSAKMAIPEEIDEMLWDHRIGQALYQRNRPSLDKVNMPEVKFVWNKELCNHEIKCNGKNLTWNDYGNYLDAKINDLPLEVKKAQWTLPHNCKFFTQHGGLYIKEEKE